MDEELRDALASDGPAGPQAGSGEGSQAGVAGGATRQDGSDADQPGVFNLHGRALKLAAALVVLVAVGTAAGVGFLRGGRRRSRWTR